MMKKQRPESTGEWTEVTDSEREFQLPRRRGIQPGAVHAAYTVAKADRTTQSFWPGNQKRQTGKRWVLKQVGESHKGKGTCSLWVPSSPTGPWTTQIQNSLKAAQLKAKDLNRVQSYCIRNRVYTLSQAKKMT